MSEEEIRTIIAEEIVKHLKFSFDNWGFECMGLNIKIEYDDSLLAYEKL